MADLSDIIREFHRKGLRECSATILQDQHVTVIETVSPDRPLVRDFFNIWLSRHPLTEDGVFLVSRDEAGAVTRENLDEDFDVTGMVPMTDSEIWGVQRNAVAEEAVLVLNEEYSSSRDFRLWKGTFTSADAREFEINVDTSGYELISVTFYGNDDVSDVTRAALLRIDQFSSASFISPSGNGTRRSSDAVTIDSEGDVPVSRTADRIRLAAQQHQDRSREQDRGDLSVLRAAGLMVCFVDMGGHICGMFRSGAGARSD